MLEYFSKACLHLKKNKIIQFGKMVISQKKYLALLFLYKKLEYIHNNPVQDLIVEKAEDYIVLQEIMQN